MWARLCFSLRFRFRKRPQRFSRPVGFFLVIVGNREWIHTCCKVRESVDDAFNNGCSPCRSDVRYCVNGAGPQTCRE